MKWLELSAERFEPIPDIQFSLKKPLFAASVVLKYWLADAGPGGAQKLRARAELRAKIPLKSEMHYMIDVVGVASNAADAPTDDVRFAFEKIWEQDESAGRGRMIKSFPGGFTIAKTDMSVDTVEVVNDSPAQLFAHLQTLPAFIQSHTEGETTYGGYIVLGHRIEALRFDRVRSSGAIEIYEVRTHRVPGLLNEDEWSELAWTSRRAFEFDYHVTEKTLKAARFHVPIIGKIEVKA